MTVALLVVLALVLAAELVNGWTDAPNSIATVVGTRVLRPRQAVVLAALFNFAGVLSGTKVAETLGKGIVRADAVDLLTIAAAMSAIVAWSTLAWWYGLPTSESHALVAGLTGAGLATAGTDVLLWEGWRKVLVGLLFSTFLGFGGALVMMVAIYWSFRRASRSTIRTVFGRAQIASAAFMAFSHGSNDGQKFMGVFTLALVLGGHLQGFHIPLWVMGLCALVMGLGTAVGGWRIIRTMGMRLTHLEPVHGFAAETGAAGAITLASALGIPVSTTHTISMAIMGVGATRKLSAVRWGVGLEIVSAWVLTFPVCGLLAWTVTMVGRLLLG